MNIRFAAAVPGEAGSLSEIAIQSKGYWGYARDLLEGWRKDLRITPEYIRSHVVRTIWLDSEKVGFFAIQKRDESILDHLWLLPRVIGMGIGGAAFREMAKECQGLGIREVIIVSDPNAEGFYIRQGAVRIGEVESIPQGRMLPRLRYRIPGSAGDGF